MGYQQRSSGGQEAPCARSIELVPCCNAQLGPDCSPLSAMAITVPRSTPHSLYTHAACSQHSSAVPCRSGCTWRCRSWSPPAPARWCSPLLSPWCAQSPPPRRLVGCRRLLLLHGMSSAPAMLANSVVAALVPWRLTMSCAHAEWCSRAPVTSAAVGSRQAPRRCAHSRHLVFGVNVRRCAGARRHVT